MREIAKHSIIDSVRGTLSIYMDLVKKSSAIENSRNYLQYGKETIFHNPS